MVNADGTDLAWLNWLSYSDADALYPVSGPGALVFIQIEQGLTLLTSYGFSDVVGSVILDHDVRSIGFSFSGDLAFEADGDIWVSEAGGASAVNLTLASGPNEANSDPSWSPDGNQIAYEAIGVIKVMSRDGLNIRTITEGTDPSWSPFLNETTNIAPKSWGAVKPMGWTPY
jgi:hypothetical protein